MKQINSYIIEKLKLNKDIDTTSELILEIKKYLTDIKAKYHFDEKDFDINMDENNTIFVNFRLDKMFGTTLRDITKDINQIIKSKGYSYYRGTYGRSTDNSEYGYTIKFFEEYHITEKLHLNKDMDNKHPLDRIFKDIYELVDALNNYLDQDLAKPIKIINSEVCFRPDGPYGHNGVYVKEHFIIEFKYSATKIRFGNQRNYGLVMQFIYRDGNKPSYGYMRKQDGYKFEKDNFLEWLKNPENKKTSKPIIDYFRLEDD